MVDVLLVWFQRWRCLIKQDAMIWCKHWLAGPRGGLGVQRRSSTSAMAVNKCVRVRCVFSISGCAFWDHVGHMASTHGRQAAAPGSMVRSRGEGGKGRSRMTLEMQCIPTVRLVVSSTCSPIQIRKHRPTSSIRLGKMLKTPLECQFPILHCVETRFYSKVRLHFKCILKQACLNHISILSVLLGFPVIL